MDEIELVVKIPEKVYRYAKKYNGSSMLTLREKEIGMCMNAIANGIPLPKGHGDLIDVDTIVWDEEYEMASDGSYIVVRTPIIDMAITVIKADKEG